MNDDEILKIITDEFTHPTLSTTEQYLEIHEPVYLDGCLKIDRIDREDNTDSIIAYIPVKNEYFSFAVYIDCAKKQVFNVGTESRNGVMLRATSETLKDLHAFTKLTPSRSVNKGELIPGKNKASKFTFVEYEPNPETDSFEDKLKKLLLFLNEDKEGVLKLVANADAYIDVTMDFHYGNQLLGRLFIDPDCIKMMNDLNLSIAVDLAAWGEPFK